ncbi:MAG: hypothetical protein WCH34_06475, partial [Bacteroidota bacterium]
MKRINIQGEVFHCDVSNVFTDYSFSDSLDIETASDAKGIFIKRHYQGSGKVSGYIILKLSSLLPYGTQKVDIHAIEMVYIPESTFYLGDSLSINSFRRGCDSSSFFIQSENAIDSGALASQLFAGGTYPPEGNIPASYPKGCSAFYCMKYEISQQQYMCFLNSLTFQQQYVHTAVSPASPANTLAMSSFGSARNGIVIKYPSNGTSPAVYACNYDADTIYNNEDDASTRACNFLNWNDLSAYLDWAC